MNVLIGCEKSGIVRDAFRARNHDAVSCDLRDTDVPGPHIVGDVRDVVRSRYWDLFIVHPPCQYIAASGMHWTVRGLRDPKLTDEAIELVQDCMDADVEKIAVENPPGLISSRIRPPDQTIQPNQFGDDASKRTCLWLKNLPKLRKTGLAVPRLVCRLCGAANDFQLLLQPACVQCGCDARNLAPRWSNQTDSGQNRLPPTDDRADLRAQTYPGIANAMAEQWG